VSLLQSLVLGIVQGLTEFLHETRMAWFLLLSTIPAVVIGLAIKPWVEASINRPLAVSLFLLITAGLLLLGEQIGKRIRDLAEIDAGDALFMGLLQVLALFPGVSRSGATVSAGLFRHLDRASSARFSFLMALPIMLAAGLIALYDLFTADNMTAQLGPLVAGTFAAAIVGYLAIDWLFSFISRHSLRVFAYYCLIVGVLGISMAVLRG
jgi:undecaprenyl-diphosphatase